MEIKKQITRAISLSLMGVWIAMSYDLIEANEKYIAVGIALSLIFMYLSASDASLDELNGKYKRSSTHKLMSACSALFIILAILQQIVFGWMIVSYYLMAIVILLVVKAEKEKSTTANGDDDV